MLRLISRGSLLAQKQVEEFCSLVPHLSFDAQFVQSGGDRDLATSLLTGDAPANFFTDVLDQALLDGTADVALHSAKDLPFPLPAGLTIAALTHADDRSDSLVSRDSLTLRDLPHGAKVGTSSPSRKAQLLALRPDLTIVGMRGNIGQRLAYLERGEVDALIVATCALTRLGLKEKIAEILPFVTHDLQGSLAAVVCTNRYDLLALFAPLDSRQSYGSVTLVGAGPGDVELITRKGERAIREAEILFYDALVDEAMIAWCAGEKVYVGKRKGVHSHTQEEINRLLYSATIAGKKVVRLKGGDPLIFGRGGEEIDFLGERGVAVSVVPGVSSFQGAASSLGVSLTQRGESKSITLCTAQGEEIDDVAVASTGTQIIYMGGSKCAAVQQALSQAGWSDETPVVVISKATSLEEERSVTTLAGLSSLTPPTPALIMVGAVLSRTQQTPKILYTGLDVRAVSLPGQVVHQPLIELVAKESALFPDTALYEGFIFTSKAAVAFFFEKASLPTERTVVAVGPHTAQALAEYGITVDYIPEVFDASHVAEIIQKSGARTWLYPCSSRSSNPLHALTSVEPFVLYETRLKRVEPLDLQRFSAVLFSSPSTVDAFLESYPTIPAHLMLLVYGEPSAQKLVRVGIARERIVIWPILGRVS